VRFESLLIPGAVIVRIERHSDQRGFFARTFCVDEFSAQGLPTAAVQASVSFNLRRGTVRGMHFQWSPSREGKLVRCIRGQVHDVLLDLRPDSPAYLSHVAVRLGEDDRDAVFIPPGVAHGFQTLVDETEVFYQMTDFYVPELQSGVRWDDPAFGIEWPLAEAVISERDRTYPDFERDAFEAALAQRTASGRDGRAGT
jgi:dTDP-4-dehydrorhamnose 3,5-epimerase